MSSAHDEASDQGRKVTYGRVISLDAYRKFRKNKKAQEEAMAAAEEQELVFEEPYEEKRTLDEDQCFDYTADDFFAHIMQRNMEASRKLREERLKSNSQVLKNYDIKT